MKKIIFLLMLSVCFVACKPTEKGYKAAYDAALGKREAVKSEITGDMLEGSLQQEDGPQLEEIDGVKVYLLNQRIKPNDDSTLPGEYNVAIGCYRMITNCRSQAEKLQTEGYEAFPAKNNEGDFYTIAGSFSTLQEAVAFYRNYQSKKDKTYVGLPQAPVIIFSPIR